MGAPVRDYLTAPVGTAPAPAARALSNTSRIKYLSILPLKGSASLYLVDAVQYFLICSYTVVFIIRVDNKNRLWLSMVTVLSAKLMSI